MNKGCLFLQDKIIIYKSKDNQIQLEVRLDLDKDTLWLNQAQIAQLFSTQRPAITKHLNNVFKCKELNEKTVCSILEHTADDGKKYATKFYNLDAVISVGYRVNSARDPIPYLGNQGFKRAYFGRIYLKPETAFRTDR